MSISLLANEIRNLNLISAKKLLQKLSSKQTSNNHEFDQQFLTLQAAFEIKSGKPKQAADTYNKLLLLSQNGSGDRKKINIVDDPTFLANLAVIFAVNGHMDKSQLVLNMIPRDSNIWRDQGQVWMDDVEEMMKMQMKQQPEEGKQLIKKKQRSKEDQEGSGANDRYYSCRICKKSANFHDGNDDGDVEAVEQFLVHLKRELASCLRREVSLSTSSKNCDKKKEYSKLLDRLRKLELECEGLAQEWKMNSPAVQHMKEKIQKCLSSVVLILSGK